MDVHRRLFVIAEGKEGDMLCSTHTHTQTHTHANSAMSKYGVLMLLKRTF